MLLEEYLEAFGVRLELRDALGNVVLCHYCYNHPVERRQVPAIRKTSDGTPYCGPCSRWVE